jgi:hypothetical protein
MQHTFYNYSENRRNTPSNHGMAVIIHDADYYHNASEDLIDELVENELASMKFEDFNEENEENEEKVYKNFVKLSKDFDDNDDVVVVVGGQNSLPDTMVFYLKFFSFYFYTYDFMYI